MDFQLLENLVRTGKLKREVIAEMKINKARFMSTLKENGFADYKTYVAHVLGEYRAPTSVIGKFTLEQVSEAIRLKKNIDDSARHLGIFASSLTKICRKLGYSGFAELRSQVLEEKDVSLYEEKMLSLISSGYSAKDACGICEIDYDKFRWFFIGKYKRPLGLFVKEIQGKRHYEKHERKEYRQAWMTGNIKQKLAKRVSTSILKCLGKAKLQKTSIILKQELGYTIEDLKAHLESQFDSNMTWDNHGTYWHIDHRTPVTWFKFHSISCEDFKRCWALSNLQPKEAIENIRKGNRWAD